MVYRGSTPRLTVDWRDVDKSLLDPDSQNWGIYDNKNQLQDSNLAPSWDAVNEYWYWDYTIPEEGLPGTWKLIAVAIKGDRTGVTKKVFEVEEP